MILKWNKKNKGMRIFFCITIIFCIISSFRTPIEPCVSKTELKKVKLAIRKIDFFNEYSTRKIESWKMDELCVGCDGLYFFTLISKDKKYNLFIPVLKIKDVTIINYRIYEGKRILSDTIGIANLINNQLILSGNNFRTGQKDSIKNKIIYGVWSRPTQWQ